MTLVAIADFASGSGMRVTMRHSLKPSTRAASISEGGTASKLALKTKMQMMVESSAGRRRAKVSSTPSHEVIR